MLERRPAPTPSELDKVRSILHFARLTIRRPGLPGLILRVRQQHLSYLGLRALADLAAAVLELEAKKVSGIYLEAGCALGGSALVVTAAKSPATPFYIYDTFQQIPPPSQFDGQDAHARYAQIAAGASPGLGGETYYGYRKDLLAQVQRSFMALGFPPEKNQAHFIQGLFQDTLHVDQPVAFAHLDCDWYESVLVCLQQIEPHLAPQGCLIIDDYFDWSGCRRAVDEYFADKQERYQFIRASRLLIRRK